MFQSAQYLLNRSRGCQAMSLRKVQRCHPNGCVSRLQGWFYFHVNKKLSRSDESSMICTSWAGPSLLLFHCTATPNLLLLICLSCCSQLRFRFLGYALYTQPTTSVLVSVELGGESLHTPAPALLWVFSGFWAGGAVGAQRLSESWSHVWGPIPSAGSCPGSRFHWEGVKRGAGLGGPGLLGGVGESGKLQGGLGIIDLMAPGRRWFLPPDTPAPGTNTQCLCS